MCITTCTYMYPVHVVIPTPSAPQVCDVLLSCSLGDLYESEEVQWTYLLALSCAALESVSYTCTIVHTYTHAMIMVFIYFEILTLLLYDYRIMVN